MSTAGTGVQLIKEPGSRRITGPTAEPDGRRIWYAQRTRLWQYNAILPQYQLAYYDRKTGKEYTRSARYGSAFRPTISPDGDWLVYGTRYEDATGLRLRHLTTGEERWLAYPVQRDDQESVASSDVLPGMSFTPDSAELVVSYGGKIWRVPIAKGVDPIPVPFRVRTELDLGPELAFQYEVDDSPTFMARQIRDAVPSPDGAELAFAALDRLWIRPLPEGEARRLTDLETVEAQPAWSPDGAWIAFVTWSPQGGHVYKVRADGSAPAVQLTTAPAIYQQPAWSSDGARLVAVQGPARIFREASRSFAAGSDENIVALPADGGDWTLVAPADGRSAPHLVPSDPDRIYFHHGEKGLVSIRWDGTDEEEHLKVTGPTPPGLSDPADASRILMAPSGDRGARPGESRSVRRRGADRRRRCADRVGRQPAAGDGAGTEADRCGGAVPRVGCDRRAGPLVDWSGALHLRPGGGGGGRPCRARRGRERPGCGRGCRCRSGGCRRS